MAAGLAATLTLALSGLAYGAFPQDPPNDPNYNPAEQGGLGTCTSQAADDEQHHFYSFMPQCTPLASDPENAAGMSIDKAWHDYTAGNPDTVIAYVEAGINWHNGDARELANRVFINRKELPVPNHGRADPVPHEGSVPACSSYTNDYDANGDGTFNVLDYVCDTRVAPNASDTGDANNNGILDPEDLIPVFSDGNDGYGSANDNNGYVDDISGWDFYDHQNDPATVDSQYSHANSQEKKALAEGNNGVAGAGICPHCLLLPVKGGAEALDRTDDLAQAWLYASDMNASVIVSTTADLGYSTFMKQAIDYIWDHGTVMVESSNDFNSIDHQGGMFHQHVLPGNGLVSNAHGIPTPASNALITTYRSRSGLTSWGTHNMFSGSTEGGSTSESTPTVGGVMALVMAYGREAADQDLIDHPLTPDEAVQVVRETASDINGNPNGAVGGWAGRPGWDSQYGYGRPNVFKAMQKIHDDAIPPEAWFNSPDWFKLYDPETTDSVPVTGHIAAPRSSVQSWSLDFAPGPDGHGGDPSDGDFITANTGTGPVDGSLGSIDLSEIPQSFWEKQFKLSQTKELETNEQYTVTLRLRVTDADGRVAEDRRTIAVHHDPSMKPGFPKDIGTSGESQPVLSDLRGNGELDSIFGDADGRVHAVDPDGDELPGFPVMTNSTQVEKQHAGVDPGHEPIVPGVAVGDLDHNGLQEIVAASTTGRVYAWDEHGNRLSGWPKTLDTGVTKPPIPRPAMAFTRLPVQGTVASPVLADMDGDHTLEVVQSGWDGRVHAWHPDGSDVDGWPVHVTLPDGFGPPSDHVLINDQKIDAPATLAQLDNDPEPEFLVRSQLSFAPTSTPLGGPGSVEVGGYSNVFAYNSDGSPVPGYPSSNQATIFYYGSAQEFITEGVSVPVTADVDGDGKTEWAFAPGIFSPTQLHTPNGGNQRLYAPLPSATLGLLQLLGAPDVTALTNLLTGLDLPTDAPVNFTGSGAFGKFGPGNRLTFTQPSSGAASVVGALVLAGSGIPLNNYAQAVDADTGATVPGFPSKTQGLDFLGAPVMADVDGDGSPEMIEGGDSSVLHGFTSTGTQAAGFPKFHSGWVVFGPAAGDIDNDGKTDLVATTREGYLMAWGTDGKPSGNNEWWNYRHDERNTGEYGADTRPPGALLDASLSDDKKGIDFKAPGADWYAGQVDHYQAVTSDNPITASNFDSADPITAPPPAGGAGANVTYTMPAGVKRYVALRAVDAGDNVGRMSSFDTAPGGGSGPGANAIHLRVSPRHPRKGTKYSFRLRVTSSNPSCVKGVTVRLGGHHRTSKSTGLAFIKKRFRGRGHRLATAKKAGCGRAHFSLFVRKPLG